MSKRLFDLGLSLVIGALLSPVIALVALLVRATSRGPAIHWSKRIGRNNEHFFMPKFRTMRIDTPQMATHLMSRPEDYLTPIGNFLRKSSLDEVPQLWSILTGKMSFVGPRPALYNQDDLVALRTTRGVHRLLPGLTGWAQVNGRDDLPIPVKVDFDTEYLRKRGFSFDIYILIITLLKVTRREGVKH